jgi:iron complex outermembrane receptor protein
LTAWAPSPVPQFTNASLFNGFPSALLQNLGFPVGTSNFLAGSLPCRVVSQNLFDTNNKRRHKQFSQELEFSGDTDNLDWVVGGFYFWEKGSENNPQNSGFVLDTNSACSRTLHLSVCFKVSGSRFCKRKRFAPLLAPSFRATNPARYRMVQTLSTLKYTATSESTARLRPVHALSRRS